MCPVFNYFSYGHETGWKKKYGIHLSSSYIYSFIFAVFKDTVSYPQVNMYFISVIFNVSINNVTLIFLSPNQALFVPDPNLGHLRIDSYQGSAWLLIKINAMDNAGKLINI